jgi:hypothetical protein
MMKPILSVMAGGLLLAVLASSPSAKLPAATPEEKAAASAKAEKDAAAKAKAAKDLEQVQDRLAERYGKRKPTDQSSTARDPASASGRR